MRKEIVGIFVCMLLIGTILPVSQESTATNLKKEVTTTLGNVDIEITKPKEGYVYLNDNELFPIKFATIIIGKITVEVNINSDTTVDKVEFYINNELRRVDYSEPYTWEWSEKSLLKNTLKVKAYVFGDGNGWVEEETELSVFTLKFGNPSEITFDEAVDIMKKYYISENPWMLIAFGAPEPLQPGDLVYPCLLSDQKVYQVKDKTWFFWIDDGPYVGFAHSTRYVFVNAITGEHEVIEGDWWPKVNEFHYWATPESYWNDEYWVYSNLPDNTPPPAGDIKDNSNTLSDSIFAENIKKKSNKTEIIIEGYDVNQTFRKDAENWYKLYNETFGYTADELIYLAPEKRNNGMVDYTATEKNLTGVFENLSKNLSGCDNLSIYITAHGGDKTSGNARCLGQYAGPVTKKNWRSKLKPYYLTESKLYDLVCMFKDSKKYNESVHISIVIQGCYSGSIKDYFSDREGKPGGFDSKVEVIITATDAISSSFGDIDDDFLEFIVKWKKYWLGIEETFEKDPNNDDEGSEFTSGLIEDLKLWSEYYIQGKITKKQLFWISFFSAWRNDAAYNNRKLLKQYFDMVECNKKVDKEVKDGTLENTWAKKIERFRQLWPQYNCTTTLPENPQEWYSAPKIKKTVPANNEKNVPTDTQIILNFDDVMDIDSLVEAILFDPCVGGYYITGNEDMNSFTIDPNNIQTDTIYTITISTAAIDIHGKHMAYPYTFQFITGEGEFEEYWISYNDGYTDNALGWTDGSPWIAAIELSDPELIGYRNYQLTNVHFCTGSDAYDYYEVPYNIYYTTGVLPSRSQLGTSDAPLIASGISSGTGWDNITVSSQDIPDSGSAFVIVEWYDCIGTYPAGFDVSNSDPRGAYTLYQDTEDDWWILEDFDYPAVYGIDAGLTLT